MTIGGILISGVADDLYAIHPELIICDVSSHYALVHLQPEQSESLWIGHLFCNGDMISFTPSRLIRAFCDKSEPITVEYAEPDSLKELYDKLDDLIDLILGRLRLEQILGHVAHSRFHAR